MQVVMRVRRSWTSARGALIAGTAVVKSPRLETKVPSSATAAELPVRIELTRFEIVESTSDTPGLLIRQKQRYNKLISKTKHNDE